MKNIVKTCTKILNTNLNSLLENKRGMYSKITELLKTYASSKISY